MNLIDQAVWLNIAHRVGWTLVHSLWQLAAVAVLVMLALRLLRRATTQTRYVAACSGLVLMAMLPIVTFVFVPVPCNLAVPSRASNSQHDADRTLPEIGSRSRQTLALESDGAHAASEPEPVAGNTSFNFAPVHERRPVAQVGRNAIPSETDWKSVLPIAASQETPAAPPTQMEIWRIPPLDLNVSQLVLWLTWLWIAGVVVFAAIHARGLYVVRRLCRVDVCEIKKGNPVRRRMEALADRLDLRRAIRLLQSNCVNTPMVIGWIRPVMLVPASMMTGLSPSGLDAILAHELAHIRRHDYLVNVLQVLIETLLFYHPAVWWLSQRIRLEREYCCDDVAAAVCGSHLEFAKVLVALEGARVGMPLALAANGPGKEKTMMKRIRRLVEGKSQDVAAGSGAFAVILAAMLLGGVAACFVMAGDDNVEQVAQADEQSSPTRESSDVASKPAERRTASATKKQKSLPEGLVFWNTFDSKPDIYKSNVGPGGVYRGEGGVFVDGVVGNALRLNHDDYEAVAFPKDVVSHKAGCIEFWAKLTGLPNSLPAGQRPALIQIHDGRSAYGIHFNGNDGFANGGLCGWAGRTGHCGTSAFGTWSYEKVLGEGRADQWHHYAIVWDQDGMKGVGDEDGNRQFAVYLDGKLNTHSWRDSGRTKFQPLKGGELKLHVKHDAVGQGTIAYDELKIWNYAKTEFENAHLAQVREVQLSEGLVGHWTLDGHTRDSSGRGHHGSEWTEFTSNRFGDVHQAFGGNGRSGFVTIPDSEALDTHDSFTLSAWVNPRNYVDEDGLRGLIIGKWHSGSTIRDANGEYTLKVNEEGRLHFVVGNYDDARHDKRGWDDLSSETIIPKNKWTHVAATFRKGTLTLYVGGRRDLTKQSEVTSTTHEEYVHDELRIGGLWNDHYNFDGGIDDARIYNRALCDEEVVAIHEEVPHRFAYYDASRGSLPTEHGFRLYDNNLDSAPPRVEEGVLLQGPTSTKGEQRWQSKRIPLDFRAEASPTGLSAEWIVRVVQTKLDQERQYTGWHAHFIDQHGHFFLIALAADQIVLHAFPDPKPAVAKFDTTDAFHHYRFVVDDNQGILLVDGKTLLSKPLGKPDAPIIKANRALFGDATSSAGAQTELKAFYYSNNPRAKSPFHPASPLPAKLRESLALHYSFSRGGTQAVDLSGNDNHGTIKGAKRTQNGRRGSGLQFKSGDYVEIGDPKSLKLRAVTVAAWVRFDSIADNHFSIAKGQLGNWDIDYVFQFFRTNGAITTYVEDADNFRGANRNQPVAGGWHHVAATYDGDGRATHYLDGKLIGHTKSQGKLGEIPDRYTWKIGDGGKLRRFSGIADEVMIFNRALQHREINQVYSWAASDKEVAARHKTEPARAVFYDASRGTLPSEQGFRFVDSDPDNPPIQVKNGILLQGPTTKDGYQYWHANHIPLDFRPSGAGVRAEWRLRVARSDFAPQRQHAGWTASFHDQHGHAFLIYLAQDKILLHGADPDAKPAVAKFNTTDAFHHYEFKVDDNQGTLQVDGDPLLIKPLGKPKSAKSRASRVYFGDWSVSAGGQTELLGFSYAADARAKSRFHPVPSLTAEQLQKSLILHYPLDQQRKDGAVSDESDRGNNATAHVKSELTDGVLGKAVQFNGKGEYITRDYDPKGGLHPTDTPFTVSAWFNTSSSSPIEQTIVSTHYAGLGRDGYMLSLDNTENNKNKLRFMLVAGKSFYLYSRQPCDDGRWHHAAAVWNGRTASLYLDGELQDSVETAGAISYPNRVPFVIGHCKNRGVAPHHDESFYFKGAIDDVRFYTAALPVASILELYEQRNNSTKGLDSSPSREALPRPILHNTFDSRDAILKSKIGPPGAYKGGGKFVEGKVGRALMLRFDEDDRVSFPKEIINAKSGTLMFWAKLIDFPELLSPGQNPALVQIHDGHSTFGIHLNGNDGYNNRGLCGWAGKGGHCGKHFQWAATTYEWGLGKGRAADWHHYALVWNEDGLSGVADGTKRFAVFLDGEPVTESWRGDGRPELVPLVGGELELLPDFSSNLKQGSIIFDELEAFDRALTTNQIASIALNLAKPHEGPYEVIDVWGWTRGREGYDPALPGFHITSKGPIGFIVLRSRNKTPPEKLVLAIDSQTGTGNFALWNDDITLVVSEKTTAVYGPKPEHKSMGTVNTERYFKIEHEGRVARFTLMPEAMKLLAKRCTIRWGVWR